MQVTTETINWMPKREREDEIVDGDNFSSLEFRRISTINPSKEGGGAKDFLRDDNDLCFRCDEFEVLSTWYVFGRWYINCWTRNISLYTH